MIWPKYKLKYNSFDVYHMKHNYAQEWTVSELWAIKKKALFWKMSVFIFLQAIPLFKEHVLVGNALDWQKFNWHKSHRRNGDPQLKHNHSKQHTLLFSFVSMFTPKLWFSLWFVPLASISINHLLAKHPVLKESSIPLNKGSSDSMFGTIYFKNVHQFCGIWKTSFLRSLTLGAIGAKTRFFKMWPKSTHDQKLEIFYSLRPEDRQYGSNEPKKCEIGPVVFSNVHFKVFKSYFI